MVWRHVWFEQLIQDVRYAIRTLRRNAVFTLTAVTTLAIGIGATTGIFSAVNATILRPLPFAAPDELVDVRTRYVDGRATTGFVSPVELAALSNLPSIVARASGFSYQPADATLIRDDGSFVNVTVNFVAEGFFEVLGVPMLRGRPFTHEEHIPVPGVRPFDFTGSVVLSYRAWTNLFQNDPNIIGKLIHVAERAGGLTVVGVASRDLDYPKGTDFWINLRMDLQDQGYRQAHLYSTIVRLRPGATSEQLRGASTVAMSDLARTVPNDVGRQYIFRSLLASVVGDLRPILLIVLGATALLLILACVNVTNLLLARGATQSHEIALRTAIGASRGRVIRQLLTQSIVIAMAGTVSGLVFAFVSVRMLLALGASKLPRLDKIAFDWRVLLFALVVLLVSGIVIGLVPAFRLALTDIRTMLNESSRRTTTSAGTSKIMSGMIVAEVALAIALVAGSAWLTQSFSRLNATQPGFIPEGRLVVDVRAAHSFRSTEEMQAWSNEMLRRVRVAAGTALVGSASSFPMAIDRDLTADIVVTGTAPELNKGATSRFRHVTPGFFEAMGIQIIAGRDFNVDDRKDSARVAIVNRAFARRYFPNAPALGASFAGDPNNPYRIVGIVDDVRYKSLMEEAEATYYDPEAQSFPFLRSAVVIYARNGSPDALVSNIREELKRFDPQLIATFTPAQQIVAETINRQQLGMTLMLVFGATSLVLAAVGLYGVIAYAAAQRRGELATRMALGASGRQVFWLVLKGAHRLTLIGLCFGLVLAYVSGRIVAGNIFAMRPSDPFVLITASIIVIVVALIATVIPAIKAGRQDPMRCLRSD